MAYIREFLFVVGLLTLSAMGASAQVPTGTPPFGTFSTDNAPDVVNLANLNSHIAVPVLHKSGRGTDFTYDLSYDSSVWYPVNSGSTTSWQPVYNWGWRAQTEVSTGYVSYTSTYQKDGTWCYIYWYSYVYHDEWGGSHPFSGQAERDGPNNYHCTADFWDLSGTAADGSGYSIATHGSATAVTIYSRDGKVINAPVGLGTGLGSSIDRNGNEITADGNGHFYDTLSSTIPVLTVAAPAPPSSATFTYTAPSGATPSYTMKYTTYSIQTNFGCSNITDYGTNGTTTSPLVSEIDLPDVASVPSDKFTFTYEVTPGHSGYVTGRLASVALPTGGTITYTYTGGSSGHIMCSDGSASGLTRALSDGSIGPGWSATWTYSRSGTVPATTTTIIDPQGNQTVSNFSGLYETQSQVFQSTSTLLETLLICYNNNFSNCATATVTAPITKRDVYTSLPNLANPALSETTYDSFGDLTEDKEIDFVPNTKGSPYLSDTTVTFGYVNSVNAYRQQTTVKNNAGTIVSQTTITYDVGGTTATSGTPQHTTTPTAARGNPTTISYLVQGTTKLNKTFTYYDTGNVITATDVNGAQTTFTYGACGNSFPTSISKPLSLSQSMTWNCTGGVETSATDENGKTALAAYTDPDFWRPSSTTDQLLNQTNIGYQPNPTYCCPTEVGAALTFNNGNSQVYNFLYEDGLGRTYVRHRGQVPGSSTFDTVSYTFDANGRPYSVSMPCSAAATVPCSTPQTTQTYDALNRPRVTTDGGTGTVTNTYSQNDVLTTIGPKPSGENTKNRQLEYDALGRLTSVCEITGAPGSGPCGQNTSATGYWTRYKYDALGNLIGVCQNTTQPTSVDCIANPSSGQQTRSYSYDDLSRMTSETNPESGTMTYSYDTDGTCSLTFSGDLVRKYDANGNTTCYSYDALHRLTWVKYPSGPNAANSYARYYWYDAPYVNNTSSTAYLKGRLSAAGTCTTPTCSVNTHSWTHYEYAYDGTGRQTDVWEQTPNSGGTYHTTATYWPNGALASLSGIPGQGTYTFGVDGEGRNNSVSQGSSALVSSVLFNPASQVTHLNFGNGDHDDYQYDSNSGRAAQYSFTVGATPQTESGTLTWNPNGTLQQLAISDPFNSNDNQICTYGHDDLVRLSNANCGAVWSQSFTYDSYGNLTKTGSIPWTPGYNPATNRYTLSGTSYDSNGNLLNDTFNTYTWDSSNLPVAIGPRALTYDAFGREVEKSSSGTYQWSALYTPVGRVDFLTGQSPNYLELNLPGGTRLLAWTGAQNFTHGDWLGSTRLESTIGRTVSGTQAYAPFGEPYVPTGQTEQAFAGMEMDTASGEFDADARKQNAVQGRWISPDPAGLAAVDPSNPQSWNRYAYVLNNPLAMTDPTGMDGSCSYVIDGTQYTYCVGNGGGGDGNGLGFNDTGSGDFGGGAGGFTNDDPRSNLWCKRNYHSTFGGSAPPGTCGQPMRKPPPPPPSLGGVLSCASKTANLLSIAGLINVDENAHPALAAVTNGLLGNTFSGMFDTGTHVVNTLSATNLHGRSLGLLQVTGDLAFSGLSQGLPIASENPAVIGAVGQATSAILGTTAALTFGLGKFALDAAIFAGSITYCATQ